MNSQKVSKKPLCKTDEIYNSRTQTKESARYGERTVFQFFSTILVFHKNIISFPSWLFCLFVLSSFVSMSPDINLRCPMTSLSTFFFFFLNPMPVRSGCPFLFEGSNFSLAQIQITKLSVSEEASLCKMKN